MTTETPLWELTWKKLAPRLNQKESEIRQLYDFLFQRPGRSVAVEIGCLMGGTADLFARLYDHVVTVDIAPMSEPESANVDLIRGDSRELQTLKAVENITGHADLLFIDGGHDLDQVRGDFWMYKDFCVDGSIVAFHDIQSHTGVCPFWTHELKPWLHECGVEFVEFIEDPSLYQRHNDINPRYNYWGGIGAFVYRKGVF